MLLIDLYGGEPFIREDLGEIIKIFAINNKTKYFSIPTNAYYTERMEKILHESLTNFPDSFFRMAISIDGPEQVHNRVRKLKDGYKNAMRTVRMIDGLREHYPNISMSLNSVYNRTTESEMASFIEDMIELNVFDSINLGIVRENTYDPSLKEVDVERYYEIRKRAEGYSAINRQPFSPLQKAMETETKNIIESAIKNPSLGRQFKCYGAKKFALLDDQGEVFACEQLLTHSMGNVRENDYNIQKIIDSESGKKNAELYRAQGV
jgi:MoaA/NifB/PqqE/SkfB family radical SAM enzyme